MKTLIAIPKTLWPHFIRWATINHSDCKKYRCANCLEVFDHPPEQCPNCGGFVEPNECDIADKLKQYAEGQATFQQVYDTVIEIDDGWEESWENYRKYNKL